MVKNRLPMQEIKEIQVQSLGWENPLKEGMTTHSSILVEESMGREAWWATVHSRKESDTTEMTEHSIGNRDY